MPSYIKGVPWRQVLSRVTGPSVVFDSVVSSSADRERVSRVKTWRKCVQEQLEVLVLL